MNTPDFPRLSSPRLSLRPLEEEDWAEICFLRSDPSVNQWVVRPRAENREEALAFIHKIRQGYLEGHMYYWVICLPAKPKMLGSICLWNFSDDRKAAETGYDLHPDWQGKGIMQEALISILKYGFVVLRLGTVLAFTHRKNGPSRKLLERNHFRLKVGELDESNPHNFMYTLAKSDFTPLNQEDKITSYSGVLHSCSNS